MNWSGQSVFTCISDAGQSGGKFIFGTIEPNDHFFFNAFKIRNSETNSGIAPLDLIG